MTDEWVWNGAIIKRVRKKQPYWLQWTPIKREKSCPLAANPHLHEGKIVVQRTGESTWWYGRVTIWTKQYSCAEIVEGINWFDQLMNNKKIFDRFLDNTLMEELL